LGDTKFSFIVSRKNKRPQHRSKLNINLLLRFTITTISELSKAVELPALVQFTLFPKLPKELRIKVWQFVAREPRIVEVCQLQDSQYIAHATEDNNYEWRNSGPFYSPTAIPVILHINRESRVIALENYNLSVPHSSHPAQIYYNPFVDILYFPAWCFQYDISCFETATRPEIKDTIRRIAIDNLIWFSGWDDGTINNQIQIDGFKNLEELLLVTREPGELGCGCCHEFEGPEKGVPEFVGFVDGNEGSKGYFERGISDCLVEFMKIKELDADWNAPEVRFVQLKRDGVLI
jgi:2EXR family